MNIDSAFPSNYLKASDLADKSPVVTIDRIDIEPIGRDKEMKPVIYFQGKEKGLVLNKTNAKKIAELTGSKDTDDWTGCQIRIYASQTEFSGEMVECVRVKAAGAQKAQTKPAPPPEPVQDLEEDEVPFAWIAPLVLPLAGLTAAGMSVLA
jgi:hypothetical protein